MTSYDNSIFNIGASMSWVIIHFTKLVFMCLCVYAEGELECHHVGQECSQSYIDWTGKVSLGEVASNLKTKHNLSFPYSLCLDSLVWTFKYTHICVSEINIKKCVSGNFKGKSWILVEGVLFAGPPDTGKALLAIFFTI